VPEPDITDGGPNVGVYSFHLRDPQVIDATLNENVKALDDISANIAFSFRSGQRGPSGSPNGLHNARYENGNHKISEVNLAWENLAPLLQNLSKSDRLIQQFFIAKTVSRKQYQW
jgi:hypothetical protein